MKGIIVCCLCMGIFLGGTASAQTSVEAFGKTNKNKKNFLGGYDYYDENGQLIGYSSKGQGNYQYYDTSGKYVGKMKQQDGKYIMYNANDVKVGSLNRTASKKYRVKSQFRHDVKELENNPSDGSGDVGSLDILDLLAE